MSWKRIKSEPDSICDGIAMFFLFKSSRITIRSRNDTQLYRPQKKSCSRWPVILHSSLPPPLKSLPGPLVPMHHLQRLLWIYLHKDSHPALDLVRVTSAGQPSSHIHPSCQNSGQNNALEGSTGTRMDHTAKKKKKKWWKTSPSLPERQSWHLEVTKILLKGINLGGDRGQSGRVWLWELKPC